MYFTNLREDLNDPNKRIDDINKQRINLSDHACSILLHDMDAFHDQLKIPPGSGEIGSPIINHILRCFRDDADATVCRSCEKKRKQLAETLSGLEEPLRKQAILPLIKQHRQIIEAQVRRDLSRKGNAFSIRLSTDNLSFLSSLPFPDWEEGAQEAAQRLYRDKVGSYLKAVIEEYARKSYNEREAIFCKQALLSIQEAIGLGRLMKITTRNQYIQYVKPYIIEADSEQFYHYLAGFLAPAPEGPWRLGSIRLSAITGCEILYSPSSITAGQATELETTIRENGIQFLSDAASRELPAKIVVKFTEEGKRMYHQMLHLRPMYSGNPKRLTYEFTATQRQAENYFFKFGHNVKILEPKELADKFRRRYESAAKLYR